MWYRQACWAIWCTCSASTAGEVTTGYLFHASTPGHGTMCPVELAAAAAVNCAFLLCVLMCKQQLITTQQGTLHSCYADLEPVQPKQFGTEEGGLRVGCVKLHKEVGGSGLPACRQEPAVVVRRLACMSDVQTGPTTAANVRIGTPSGPNSARYMPHLPLGHAWPKV
jgi:hypothetical protein